MLINLNMWQQYAKHYTCICSTKHITEPGEDDPTCLPQAGSSSHLIPSVNDTTHLPQHPKTLCPLPKAPHLNQWPDATAFLCLSSPHQWRHLSPRSSWPPTGLWQQSPSLLVPTKLHSTPALARARYSALTGLRLVVPQCL